MNDLNLLAQTSPHVIVLKEGNYNQIIFPYSEQLLIALLNGVRISTTYAGKFEKILQKVEVNIVNSSEFKHTEETAIASEEV